MSHEHERLAKLAADLGDADAAHTLERWERRRNAPSAARAHRHPITRVALSPCGRWALSHAPTPLVPGRFTQLPGDSDTLVWSCTTGQLLLQLSERALRFSRTDTLLVSGEGEVRVLRLPEGEVMGAIATRDDVYDAHHDPDDHTLTLITRFAETTYALHTQRVTTRHEALHTEPLHGSPPRFLTPHGARVVTPEENGVALRDSDTDACLLRLPHGEHDVDAEGRLLLFGDTAGHLRLIELEGLRERHRFVHAAAFPEAPFAAELTRLRDVSRASRDEQAPLLEAARALHDSLRGALWQLVQRCLDFGLQRALGPGQLPLSRVALRPGWSLEAEAEGIIALRTRGMIRARSPLGAVADAAHALVPDGSPASWVEAALLLREMEHFGHLDEDIPWRRERFVEHHLRDVRVAARDVRAATQHHALPGDVLDAIFHLELSARSLPRLEDVAPGAPNDWTPRVSRDGDDVLVRFVTLRLEAEDELLEHAGITRGVYVLHRDRFVAGHLHACTREETVIARRHA